MDENSPVPGRSSTLQLRILSALIAAPLAVSAVFLLPPLAYALVFLVLAGVALDEWGRLSGFDRALQRLLYFGVYALACWTVTRVAGGALVALGIISVGWLVGIGLVLSYPRSHGVLAIPGLIPLTGLLVFVGAWLGLVELRGMPGGAWLVVWLFVVVWSADIGAYFAGRAFGKHKLARAVSPGKTWEGAFGGLLAAMLLAGLMAGLVPALVGLPVSLGVWVGLAMALGALSIFGDLFESLLKRETGVKDSGGLLPGHGGLLDRVDALIAALPVFALLMLLARQVD